MEPQQHARLNVLLQQKRYVDGEAILRDELAQNPDDPLALTLMAIALLGMHRAADALGVIDLAMKADPESDRIQAWKSRILLTLHRHDEALRSARQAIALDAEDPFNWSAKAAVHVQRGQWEESESACRSALEIDPRNEDAHHMLSLSLRLQGKTRENEGNIAARLADNPENTITHCNAGYAGLRRGDHRKAREHFADALRLDASLPMARDGLIESLRAHSFIYRRNLAYGYRPIVFIMGFVLVLALSQFLRTYDDRLATAPVMLYMTWVLWIAAARGLSTLFLLRDRFARLALRSREKWEALIVGGGFTSGGILLVAALCVNSNALFITGSVLLGQSLPAALFFGRTSHRGRRVYGSLATITWACAAIAIFEMWTRMLPAAVGISTLYMGDLTILLAAVLAMYGVARH